MIDKLVEAKGDAGTTKDLLENLRHFMSERQRLKMLVHRYSKVQGDLTSLKAECNNLLKDLGREEANNFDGYFYAIRNYIFHQYWSFPDKSIPLLDNVLEEVVSLLPDLLNTYKTPN